MAERVKIWRFMADFKFETAENSLWMPVYTQPLHEFRLRDYMQAHNITCYLPLLPEWKVQKVRSAKNSYEYKKIVFRPMFRGYLFARLSPEEKLCCWQSKSVVAFLDVLPEAQESFIRELQTVQMVEELGKNSPVEFGSGIAEGETFVIESGIFEGTYGKLLKKNRRFLWTVEIECLNTTWTVEIDPSSMEMRKLQNE